MITARGNVDAVEGAYLHHVVAELGVAVTSGTREPVVIDLRLRVVMRRVARPSAGKGHHFTEHQLRFRRRVAAIEDGAHVAQRAVIEQALATMFVRYLIGREYARAEATLVGAFIDGPLGVAASFDDDGTARRGVHAAGSLVE